MSDLVILLPVLGRPHRIEPVLTSALAVTPQARVLFIASSYDDVVLDKLESVGADYLKISDPPHGQYAKKINTGYRRSTEPYLFLGADDLHFHPGWFEAAVRHFADPTVGVVGTQDLSNGRVIRGTHSTHSLVRRDYVDRFGLIDRPGLVLYEGYPHEYVDDELVETAKFRGAFRFEHASIVEHLHPLAGKAPMDDLYADERRRMRVGAPIFRKRSKLWR